MATSNNFLLNDSRLLNNCKRRAALYAKENNICMSLGNNINWQTSRGAELFVIRTIKSLRAGRPLPTSVTATENSHGLLTKHVYPLRKIVAEEYDNYLQRIKADYEEATTYLSILKDSL